MDQGHIVRTDKRRFFDDINQQFQDTMDFAVETMKEQLSEPLRNYPDRVTVRKSGEVVTTPRNVIDLKELYNKLKDESERFSRYLEWYAEHSIYIYRGTDRQPPYPWISKALQRIELKKEFWKRERQ